MPDDRYDRARAGELDAVAELLREHGPAVRARIGGETARAAGLDADDVMQVTYVEAFLRIADFAGTGADAFRAWLAAIARHNLADGLRALARRGHPGNDDRVGDLLQQLAGGGTSPSRAAARGEVRQWIAAALAELPTDYARVVELYDLQGADIDRVAAELGRSRGAVHMLRLRAHDRLRALLGRADRFLTRSR